MCIGGLAPHVAVSPPCIARQAGGKSEQRRLFMHGCTTATREVKVMASGQEQFTKQEYTRPPDI